MLKKSIIFLVGIIFTNLILANDSVCDKPILQYQLLTEESYALNQAVIIRFVLKNMTDKNIWVLKWYTPIEGIQGNIFQLTCNNQEIFYQGRLVKRGNPFQDDYILIEPNKLVSAEVDLSTSYNLLLGECQVIFRGVIHDITYDKTQIPKEMDQHQGLKILGNIASFKLTTQY